VASNSNAISQNSKYSKRIQNVQTEFKINSPKSKMKNKNEFKSCTKFKISNLKSRNQKSESDLFQNIQKRISIPSKFKREFAEIKNSNMF
jgi:hypothetical protein